MYRPSKLFSLLVMLPVALADNTSSEALNIACAQRFGTGSTFSHFDDSHIARCHKPAQEGGFCLQAQAYVDPKTNHDACCPFPKVYVVDTKSPREGACCAGGQVYSFDAMTNQGRCCLYGQVYREGACCAEMHVVKPDRPSPPPQDNCASIGQCLPKKIVLDQGGALECQVQGGDFKCKALPGPGGKKPWSWTDSGVDSSEGADDLSEIGPLPQTNICPRLNGKEFTTTVSGHTAKWRVHCTTWVAGHRHLDKICDGGSVVQILQQRQLNKNYRGLFWNSAGVCQEVVPKDSGTWEGYALSTVANHAFIERLDFKG